MTILFRAAAFATKPNICKRHTLCQKGALYAGAISNQKMLSQCSCTSTCRPKPKCKSQQRLSVSLAAIAVAIDPEHVWIGSASKSNLKSKSKLNASPRYRMHPFTRESDFARRPVDCDSEGNGLNSGGRHNAIQQKNCRAEEHAALTDTALSDLQHDHRELSRKSIYRPSSHLD